MRVNRGAGVIGILVALGIAAGSGAGVSSAWADSVAKVRADLDKAQTTLTGKIKVVADSVASLSGRVGVLGAGRTRSDQVHGQGQESLGALERGLAETRKAATRSAGALSILLLVVVGFVVVRLNTLNRRLGALSEDLRRAEGKSQDSVPSLLKLEERVRALEHVIPSMDGRLGRLETVLEMLSSSRSPDRGEAVGPRSPAAAAPLRPQNARSAPAPVQQLPGRTPSRVWSTGEFLRLGNDALQRESAAILGRAETTSELLDQFTDAFARMSSQLGLGVPIVRRQDGDDRFFLVHTASGARDALLLPATFQVKEVAGIYYRYAGKETGTGIQITQILRPCVVSIVAGVEVTSRGEIA